MQGRGQNQSTPPQFTTIDSNDIHIGEKVLNKAKQSDPTALCHIGRAYHIRFNYKQAIIWYIRALKHNDADSAYHIATMYSLGEYFERNEQLATLWYRKAAIMGSASARNQLTIMYMNGSYGLPEHKILANKWFQLDPMDGDRVTQFNIGYMLEFGNGIKDDKKGAAEWYRKSMEQGFPLAKEYLERLLEEYPDIESKKDEDMMKDIINNQKLCAKNTEFLDDRVAVLELIADMKDKKIHVIEDKLKELDRAFERLSLYRSNCQ